MSVRLVPSHYLCQCWSRCLKPYGIRDQPKYAPSQWEASLHCNDASHSLGTYLTWSMGITRPQWLIQIKVMCYFLVVRVNPEGTNLFRSRSFVISWRSRLTLKVNIYSFRLHYIQWLQMQMLRMCRLPLGHQCGRKCPSNYQCWASADTEFKVHFCISGTD